MTVQELIDKLQKTVQHDPSTANNIVKRVERATIGKYMTIEVNRLFWFDGKVVFD